MKAAARFLAFAALGFAFDLGLLLLLRHMTPLPGYACVSIAFWATYALNFVLNRYFTFEANHSNVGPQLARFAVQVIGDYALTLAVSLGLQALGLNLALSRLAAGGTNLVFNYVLYRWWTFRPPTPVSDPAPDPVAAHNT